MEPKVAVVILNWYGWRDTVECLESLFQVSYESMFVIVVDNGSTDDSIQRLREYCQGGTEIQSSFLRIEGVTQPVSLVEYAREDVVRVPLKNSRGIGVQPKRMITLIRNEQNYGFAEGCNIGMRYALAAIEPEYILLLNNDTVADRELLGEMVRIGESDERIGIMGPKIYYYDFNGRRDVILYAGGRISPWREVVFTHVGWGEVDRGQYDLVGETEWCSGAALLLKKKLAKEGLLNSAYKFGIEDVEYCMNARKRGYKVVYVPSAKIWHKEGVSSRKLGRRIRRDTSRYFYFIRENFSGTVFVYHIVMFFGIVLPKWAIDYLSEGSDKRTFHSFLNEMRQFFRYLTRGGLGE